MAPVFEPRTTTKRFIPSLNPTDSNDSGHQGFPHFADHEYWYTPAAEARKRAKDPKATKATLSSRIKTVFRKSSCSEQREPTSDELPSGTPAPSIEEASPFNHMIEAYYVPEGYYDDDAMYRTPWSILLRMLLVDLPHQLKDTDPQEHGDWDTEDGASIGTGDTDRTLISFRAPEAPNKHPGVPWRDHAPPNNQVAVPFGMETTCGRRICGCCRKWGRRIVFEPELPPPGQEQDRWLVVAYVIGEDRRWVEDVDVRNMISFQKSYLVVGIDLELPILERPEYREFFAMDRRHNDSSLLYTPNIKFGDEDPAYDQRARFLQEQLGEEVLIKLLG